MGAYGCKAWRAMYRTALLVWMASSVHAATIDVTIDSSFLNGAPAVLAFDFIDGGSPDNSVTLSALTSDGTSGATSTTGNVTGSGPWMFSDAGGSFFNELLVTFNPMGTSLSFSITTTDNAPSSGSLPDAFSMFALDPTATSAVITTDDPTGANALLLFNLGEGANGIRTYASDQTGFSVSAVPAQIPGPSPLALLLAGAAAWLASGGSRKRAALSSRTGPRASRRVPKDRRRAYAASAG